MKVNLVYMYHDSGEAGSGREKKGGRWARDADAGGCVRCGRGHAVLNRNILLRGQKSSKSEGYAGILLVGY